MTISNQTGFAIDKALKSLLFHKSILYLLGLVSHAWKKDRKKLFLISYEYFINLDFKFLVCILRV